MEEEIIPQAKNSRFELKLDPFDGEKQKDHLWMARTGLNRDTLCGAVETVIFISDRPLSLEKIRNSIDKDIPTEVLQESLKDLQQMYNTAAHGIQLTEVAGGYQLRTKSLYTRYAHNLFKPASLVLSPSALEVLAIIAYKQPVIKAEINRIRGVDSGHIIRGLMDKRLIKTSGRSDDMGRPVFYSTTSEFLEVFNLSGLHELPPEHELKSMLENGKGEISDIRTLVSDGEKNHFELDEMQELDQLAASIKSISTETDFTTSLKSEEQKKNRGEKEVFSAFELLEQYVARQSVTENNKKALGSEQLHQLPNPSIVQNIPSGPLNLPERQSSGDGLQTIDLESGNPLKDQEGEENGKQSKLQAKLERKIEKLEAKTGRLAKDARGLGLNLDFVGPERPSRTNPENNTDN